MSPILTIVSLILHDQEGDDGRPAVIPYHSMIVWNSTAYKMDWTEFSCMRLLVKSSRHAISVERHLLGFMKNTIALPVAVERQWKLGGHAFGFVSPFDVSHEVYSTTIIKERMRLNYAGGELSEDGAFG